jgi:hypothetical protein
LDFGQSQRNPFSDNFATEICMNQLVSSGHGRHSAVRKRVSDCRRDFVKSEDSTYKIVGSASTEHTRNIAPPRFRLNGTYNSYVPFQRNSHSTRFHVGSVPTEPAISWVPLLTRLSCGSLWSRVRTTTTPQHRKEPTMSILSFAITLTHQVKRWSTTLLGSPKTHLWTPHQRLALLTQQDEGRLPRFVRESRVAMKYVRLFSALDWEHFPDRPAQQRWPHALPLASFAAAYLVALNQHLPSMGHLREYLAEHPPLVWLLGFPLVPAPQETCGFDVEVSLPTARHLGRLLRTIPNEKLQFLLGSSVHLIQAELATEVHDFGESVSLDTKHVPSTSSEQASPGSRRTIPKPTSATATTRTSSPQATPTAAWAASAAITSGPRRPTHLLPLPPTPSPPTPSPSESTTGAMPLASSPPRPTAGASSSWPNSPSPSTSPTSPTSSHS